MKKFKGILLFCSTLVFFILPFVAYSQGQLNPAGDNNPTPVNQQITISNPLKCDGQDCSTLLGLITAILNNIIMPIAAVAVVCYIIWAGWKYVQAQGNPKAIEDANRNLLWALIGAGVLLGAAGISAVVQTTVNSFIAH